MKGVRYVSILVMVILFFAIGYLAVDFLQKPQPNPTTKKEKEGFTSRASDCKCLPGYIPSNISPSIPNGGKIIREGGKGIHFVPAGTFDRYWVSSCQPSGTNINFCDPAVFVDVTDAEYKKYTSRGTFTSKIMEDAKKTKLMDSFFCQNSNDPTDIRMCY